MSGPSPHLSYAIELLDATQDAERDEGEARAAPLRAALRLFAKAAGAPRLVDPSADESLGAMLAARKSAELGAPLLSGLLDSAAEARPEVCLVSASMLSLEPEEADELLLAQRMRCFPVQGGTRLLLSRADAGDAVFATTSPAPAPHVVATFSSALAGGARVARLDVERVAKDAVKITTVSCTGTRRALPSATVPAPVLEKLFEPQLARPLSELPALAGPDRRNELPEYLKLALVDVLERRMRLQVLTTAAECSPAYRPVALERAYLRELDVNARSHLCVRAFLHPSSSSCICRAHGLSFDVPGRVQVDAQTCGRRLQPDSDGNMRCPLHADAVDASGAARCSVDGFCTEAVSLSVRCTHSDKGVRRKGVCVDASNLGEAGRRELGALLVGVDEFEGRTHRLFAESGAVRDRVELARHTQVLAERFEERRAAAAAAAPPPAPDPKELEQLDILAVDMLRGGGVFRHRVKKGENRGRTYLQRERRRHDDQPLNKEELAIAGTHGHLFRQSAK